MPMTYWGDTPYIAIEKPLLSCALVRKRSQSLPCTLSTTYLAYPERTTTWNCDRSKDDTRSFFSFAFLSNSRRARNFSCDIPPRSVFAMGLEGHTKPFDPRPCTWRTPPLHQKASGPKVCLCAPLSCLFWARNKPNRWARLQFWVHEQRHPWEHGSVGP